MAKQIRSGTTVQYRDDANRLRHAIVTAVTSQTQIDVRIGNGSTAVRITDAPRVDSRDGGGAGFVRHV